MFDEILPLQLITVKLGGRVVSLEIEITSSIGRTETESTTGFFQFPCVRYFYFPWNRHQIEANNSSESHRQSAV